MRYTPLTVHTPELPAAAGRLSHLMTRPAIGTLLVALGVLVLASVAGFQRREAAVSVWVLEELLGRPSRLLAFSPTVLFQRTPGDDASWTGVVVTADTSAAHFVGGTLLAAGLLALLWRRARPARLLWATLTTVLLLVGVNTVHIVAIAEIAARSGSGGSEWAHTAVGPLLMAATLCLSGIVLLNKNVARKLSRPGG